MVGMKKMMKAVAGGVDGDDGIDDEGGDEDDGGGDGESDGFPALLPTEAQL